MHTHKRRRTVAELAATPAPSRTVAAASPRPISTGQAPEQKLMISLVSGEMVTGPAPQAVSLDRIDPISRARILAARQRSRSLRPSVRDLLTGASKSI